MNCIGRFEHACLCRGAPQLQLVAWCCALYAPATVPSQASVPGRRLPPNEPVPQPIHRGSPEVPHDGSPPGRQFFWHQASKLPHIRPAAEEGCRRCSSKSEGLAIPARHVQLRGSTLESLPCCQLRGCLETSSGATVHELVVCTTHFCLCAMIL